MFHLKAFGSCKRLPDTKLGQEEQGFEKIILKYAKTTENFGDPSFSKKNE